MANCLVAFNFKCGSTFCGETANSDACPPHGPLVFSLEGSPRQVAGSRRISGSLVASRCLESSACFALDDYDTSNVHTSLCTGFSHRVAGAQLSAFGHGRILPRE